MRYSDIDLQIEDVMWFAVDRNGKIGAFTSGGCANVPEFVCKSREDNKALYDYFMYHFPDSTCGELFYVPRGGSLEEDCVLLVGKGIICFDVYMGKDYYVKVATTGLSAIFDDLADNIKTIMKDHVIDADFTVDTNIHVVSGV